MKLSMEDHRERYRVQPDEYLVEIKLRAWGPIKKDQRIELVVGHYEVTHLQQILARNAVESLTFEPIERPR